MDRLRQHRASYPLQTQLETKLRRPSGIAEAAVVRGGRNNVMVVPNRAVQRSVPAQPPRPYLPLQYAINELHERIPTPPEIRREIATECVKELSPMREPGLKARSISPRQMINVGPPLSLDNSVSRETDSPTLENMDSDENEEDKPKVRRHTVHSMPKQSLAFPENHPLLRGRSEETHEESNIHAFQIKPAIVVSHCGPSNSLMTSTPPVVALRGSGQHLHNPVRRNGHVLLGRRASDGNAVTLAFQQHLRVSSPNNRIKQLQQEHQRLQEQYQKSLSPSEISDQQVAHSEYKLNYDQMREELQKHYEELMAYNEQERTNERMELTDEQKIAFSQAEQPALYSMPLHHQLQQLHIDNRHNPLRRTPSYKQNPHKQVFRTSSYKRAQICAMLPPLESEPFDSLENKEPLICEDKTKLGRYSIISL